MTTAYPGALDAFVNPIGTDLRTSPDHAAQHANKNDAIEALEAKVGVNGSAVPTSHDKRITDLEAGSGGAAFATLFKLGI